MLKFDYSILQCPITKENLIYLSKDQALDVIKKNSSDLFKAENISGGFLNECGTYFYPVFSDILLLLSVYALYVGDGDDKRGKMAFDKERVFKYYNEINYDIKDELKIYDDATKWVDFRDVSSDYIRNSFTRTKRYLNTHGKYLLDVASGPISFQEYIELSENFDTRICIDISVKALMQAKYNYRNRKGIYICADITSLPLKESACDSVLCQHTLYHIPKNEQKIAVEEMYKVTKPGGKIVIVYSQFYHSLLLNISILPIQIYRVARHLAGKVFVRIFNSKPRLYFYPHSINWFKKTFVFSNKIDIYCWRSVNKYFLKIYIHEWLFGREILKWLKISEEKYPKFWGRIGEYPIILIEK